MNDRTLEILIKAKNAAGPGMKNAGRAVKKFSDTTKRQLRSINTSIKENSKSWIQNYGGVAAAAAAVFLALKRIYALFC